MFIAMNRFKVVRGREAEFEAVWLGRDIKIRREPGFREFHLLKGPQRADHTLYSSHTVWASEEHFVAWTRSEAFREAHKGAGSSAPLYLGGPEFEGFSVVQTVTPEPTPA
jgi:heme-degrading monooxygenase HmoA